MARKRKSKRNDKIPPLDREGTILEYLISGKSEDGTEGHSLAISHFFDDTEGVIDETRKFYKAEIQEEIKRRKENDNA